MTKIKNNDFFGIKGINLVSSFVESKLDGSDYDSGKIEELQSTQSNMLESFGKLCQVLGDKHMLDINDIKYILNMEVFDLELIREE